MRLKAMRFLATAMVCWCLSGPAVADEGNVRVKFVELKQQEGNAVLVVELTNLTSGTNSELQFGCWTEDTSKIEGAQASGSRYMAFNTGSVAWSGELKPNESASAEGVIAGMPGDMVAMFSDQSFACGTS